MTCRRNLAILFSVLSLIFLVSHVSAQTLEVMDVSITPSVVWLNENPQVSIYAKCVYNGSAIYADDARVEIKSPSGLTTTENMRYSSGTYSSSFSLFGFSEIGTYTASVICDYDGMVDSQKKTFTVRQMQLSIVNEGSSISAYMGESFEIKVDFRVDGSPVSLAKDNYEILIGEEEVEAVSIIGTSSYQKINIDPCPGGDIEECLDDLPEGLYDLEVTAYYTSGRSVTDKVKNYVDINPPMKIDFNTNTVKCVVGSFCNPSISFDLSMTSGDASDIEVDDVSARILGNRVFESAYVEDLQCDKQADVCTLKVNIPANLQPGTYDLFVSIDKRFGDDYYTVEEPLVLDVVLELSGVMKDAAGEVVSSVFTFTDIDTGQIFSAKTDYSGKYVMEILPGDYSMEARFGGTLVRFGNVTLSSDDFMLGLAGNLIRYDEGHLNSEAPGGVRVIKVSVVEFALPASSAWFYSTYNSGLVSGDENNLKVYKCENWNFEKGSCSGVWEPVSAEVHTIRNAVEYSVDSPGAFIIGEQRALYLRSVELEKDKVFIGDTVVVNGKIMDSDGQPVEDAQIKLSFPDYGITSSTTSTTGGFFRGTIVAPHTVGYPDLLLEASKSSYASSSMTSTVGVSRKKEVSVYGLPESVDVKLDESQTIRFKVFNSGQINITDPIYLKVTGIPSSWYSLSLSQLGSLAVSESADVDLTISLTSDLCADGGCDQFSLVSIEASSEGLSDVGRLTLSINTPGNETQESSEGSSGISLPSITGFAVAVPSVGNPYLPLTIIIILIILIVNKKKTTSGTPVKKTKSRKKAKSSPKLRDSVMISLNNIKREL